MSLKYEPSSEPLTHCSSVQGQYEEAVALFQKSLDIDIKVHGPEDPSVATSYNNVAHVLRSQVRVVFVY